MFTYLADIIRHVLVVPFFFVIDFLKLGTTRAFFCKIYFDEKLIEAIGGSVR